MTDARTDHEDSTGLNLFDDHPGTSTGFPTAMLGYDRQAVDQYVRETENRIVELKVQLREQKLTTNHVQEQVGSTDFGRLGAHTRSLLEAAEAQAAELVRLAEGEAERIRTEARRAAAEARETAQQEADDVRLTGLASLRKLRQEQAEAGQAALEAARRDANLIRVEAEARAKSLIEETETRVAAQSEAARVEAARVRQEAERDAVATRLAVEQDTAEALRKQQDAADAAETTATAHLEKARRLADEAVKQLETARLECLTLRENAIEEAEQLRVAVTRECEESLATMRQELSDRREEIEEKMSWRKEQLEREIAALTARKASIVASMQNLRAIAAEAAQGEDEETTQHEREDEKTAPQPRDNEKAK
ncbi:hypothetical protein [Arachnia propionica]|uniref:Uncharacterized protein n=1 Tax=Arachnia propionica TaxID=1750 RepID=A0A3P1WXU3_9ACTN|nr:hypothetical protein [Arachnia propionica]RRD50577.1 hypothetical protein EII35_04060 [Arachnia propionica]